MPDQLKEADLNLEEVSENFPYSGLIRLIADVLDNAIGGNNTYMTIGATKDKAAIIVTVSVEGNKMYVNGSSLVEISAGANELV